MSAEPDDPKRRWQTAKALLSMLGYDSLRLDDDGEEIFRISRWDRVVEFDDIEGVENFLALASGAP